LPRLTVANLIFGLRTKMLIVPRVRESQASKVAKLTDQF
jgi:hypothetical protein